MSDPLTATSSSVPSKGTVAFTSDWELSGKSGTKNDLREENEKEFFQAS